MRVAWPRQSSGLKAKAALTAPGRQPVSPSNNPRDEELTHASAALSDWPDRPTRVTGDAAKELGRMLLDDALPASEIVGALRRGA